MTTKKTSFNRSQFMKERWRVAKEKQSFFEKLMPNEKASSKNFLGKSNPLDSRIEVIYISAQANYQSALGGIYTEPKTFKVITFKGLETENTIKNKTKSAFASMKMRGETFNSGFQSAIETHTKVDFDMIRGFEEIDDYKLSSDEYLKLSHGGIIVDGLDSGVKFSKNKNNKQKGDLRYKSDLDLSEFL